MILMNPESYQSIHNQPAASRASGMRIADQAKFRRAMSKVIVCCAVVLLLFSSFLLMQTSASYGTTAPAADEQVVIVATGDTLWAIADRFTDSSKDIRRTVFEIKERNQLTSVTLFPGQELIIPSM